MNKLNFYPGPSKLDSNILRYMQDAVQSGVLERNHRSEEFGNLYQEVKDLFHDKLDVPKDYQVLFLSSATECWEVISQSLIRKKSMHIFNGAFGEKWFDYASKLSKDTSKHSFSHEESVPYDLLSQDSDLLAFTHNETANGTYVNNNLQSLIREKYLDRLIAYDATSSMGGDKLLWELGDIWFASVQKCFGLPSGLGLMIIGPKAIDQARSLGDSRHYNSLNFILDNAIKGQTHYTPNILNIYLLKAILKDREPIIKVSKLLNERAAWLYGEFDKLKYFKAYISEEGKRSNTVICLEADPKIIEQVKREAFNEDIILGNGYGSLADKTIRIANFPAIADADYRSLLIFLREFENSI